MPDDEIDLSRGVSAVYRTSRYGDEIDLMDADGETISLTLPDFDALAALVAARRKDKP